MRLTAKETQNENNASGGALGAFHSSVAGTTQQNDSPANNQPVDIRAESVKKEKSRRVWHGDGQLGQADQIRLSAMFLVASAGVAVVVSVAAGLVLRQVVKAPELDEG